MTEKYADKIVAHLIEREGTTIPEIAETLDISIGTATKAITSLIGRGFLKDCGKVATASGRKPHSYSLNPEAGYFGGVDLNDKFLSFGLMDMAGNMIRTVTNVAYKLENTPESLRSLMEAVGREYSLIPAYRDKILRTCFSIPGRINHRTGFSYTNFDFTDRPLKDILSECLGIPVTISNDTRAMTYAEYLKCRSDGEEDLIFVNVNWGLGVGLILDGKPYFGKSGFAGEFGHVHAFDNQVICRCGKKGCLETEVSGSALRRKLVEHIRNGEMSILSDRLLSSRTLLSLEEIIEAVRREDALCIDLIEEIGGLLGVQVAGLVNLFNPDAVVVGGEVAMTGDYFLQPLKTAVMRHVLARVNQDTVIRTSQLGEKAGVIGACLVARSSHFGLHF